MKPATFRPVHKSSQTSDIVARDINALANTMWDRHINSANVSIYKQEIAANSKRYRQKNRRKVYARKRVYMEVRAGRLTRFELHPVSEDTELGVLWILHDGETAVYAGVQA
jgi:hypothetical protein